MMVMIQPVTTTIAQPKTTRPARQLSTPTYSAPSSSIGTSSLSGLAPLLAEGSPCSRSGFSTTHGL